MQRVDLNQFRDGVRGSPYKALIQHHLKKQKDWDRAIGIYGTIDMIAPELHPYLEEYIDRWNLRGYDWYFWRRDCAEVFDEMIEEAKALLRSAQYPEDDETLFNIFQVQTLNFAHMVSAQRGLRRFAGIKKGWFF